MGRTLNRRRISRLRSRWTRRKPSASCANWTRCRTGDSQQRRGVVQSTCAHKWKMNAGAEIAQRYISVLEQASTFRPIIVSQLIQYLSSYSSICSSTVTIRTSNPNRDRQTGFRRRRHRSPKQTTLTGTAPVRPRSRLHISAGCPTSQASRMRRLTIQKTAAARLLVLESSVRHCIYEYTSSPIQKI